MSNSGNSFVGRPASEQRRCCVEWIYLQQGARPAGLSGCQRTDAPARGAGRPLLGRDARRRRGQQPAPGADQPAQAGRAASGDHPRQRRLQPSVPLFTRCGNLPRSAATQRRPAAGAASRSAAPGAGALSGRVSGGVLCPRRARFRGLGAGAAGATARAGPAGLGRADCAAAEQRRVPRARSKLPAACWPWIHGARRRTASACWRWRAAASSARPWRNIRPAATSCGREFDAEPSGETTALFERIRAAMRAGHATTCRPRRPGLLDARWNWPICGASWPPPTRGW